jgi:hypothetical protein
VSGPALRLIGMSPDCPSRGPLRSAEELNAAIRALFTHRDARLSDEQRAEYRALLDELRQVERRDVTTAA